MIVIMLVFRDKILENVYLKYEKVLLGRIDFFKSELNPFKLIEVELIYSGYIKAPTGDTKITISVKHVSYTKQKTYNYERKSINTPNSQFHININDSISLTKRRVDVKKLTIPLNEKLETEERSIILSDRP